jgi:citronellol/citronellal dehydrogenase
LSGNGETQQGFRSVFRPDLFAGQVILVTGGGTGIGRCTAHELAALGATVVVAARRKEKLDETAAEIADAGGICDVALLNLRDEEMIESAIASIVEKHGRIDGLVNNAGGQFVSPVEGMSPKGWRTVIDLNLNGTFLVSLAFYRHSMKEHGGAIVNMLADIWTGYPWMAHMSAARAGIENLSITLSLEWAPSGIRVNCVAPGTILSSGMHTYPENIQQRTVKEAKDIALSRLGTESEVSAVMTFLLSPAAAYITGETVKIDGGASFQKGRLIQVGRHKKSMPFDAFHLKPDFTGTPFQEFYED